MQLRVLAIHLIIKGVAAQSRHSDFKLIRLNLKTKVILGIHQDQ